MIHQAIGKTFDSPTKTFPGGDDYETASYTLDIANARITPHVEYGELGYASAGKAWLVVRFSENLDTFRLEDRNWTETWTADYAGGTTTTRKVYPPPDWSQETNLAVVLEVPADLKSVEVTATTAINIEGGSGRHTFTFGPSSVNVKFPK